MKSRASTALKQVQDRVRRACIASQRLESSVCLLAVSKTFSAEQVAAMACAGQRVFGENYIQEGVAKINAVNQQIPQTVPLEWHCLGPVQSNKTRLVAKYFDWIQSLDRLKVAERLSSQRSPNSKPLNVCIQVNIDGSPNKMGVVPDAVFSLAKAVRTLPNLRLRGVMAIPDVQPSAVQDLTLFQAMHTLWLRLRAEYPEVDTLSLGMSTDLETAISAGSTMVRVGTALFGVRPT